MKKEKNQAENHASGLPKHKKQQLCLGGYTTPSGILKLSTVKQTPQNAAEKLNSVKQQEEANRGLLKIQKPLEQRLELKPNTVKGVQNYLHYVQIAAEVH